MESNITNVFMSKSLNCNWDFKAGLQTIYTLCVVRISLCDLNRSGMISKGQLISKYPFGAIKSPQKTTKFFPGFLPWPIKRG